MSDAPRKRWLVVVPVFTHVLPAAFYNFLILVYRAGRDLPGHDFALIPAERQLLHSAMNRAAEAALSEGFDGLIAFDDDCLPPQHTIARLVAHAEAGRDFIAGMGYMRNYPHTTTVGKYYAEGLTRIADTGEVSGFHWLDSLPLRTRGVIEADFCGLPVALWTRRALERMTKPIFGTSDANGGQMTHDVFMSKRLTEAGIPVLVDTTLECGHIGPAPLIDATTRAGARAAVAFTDQQAKQQRTMEAPAVDGVPV